MKNSAKTKHRSKRNERVLPANIFMRTLTVESTSFGNRPDVRLPAHATPGAIVLNREWPTCVMIDLFKAMRNTPNSFMH